MERKIDLDPGDELRPMRSAIARTTRRAILFVLVTSVLTFGVVGGRFGENIAVQLAQEQGRLLAVAFHSAEADNLSASFDRIRAQTDRLVAVARLDDAGGVDTAVPEEPAVRQAVAAAAVSTGPVAASIGMTGGTWAVWGIRETIIVGPEKTSIPVVFLLRRHSHLPGWALISTACAAGLAVLALGAVSAMTRWFERRIVRPIRGLADRTTANEAGVPLDDAAHGGWQETVRIATRIDELLRAVEDTQARTERLERATQWELRKKEKGFHTELRRAKQQATTDELTQLKNRVFLNENLSKIVELHRDTGQDLSVVMMDLDNFKHHNDKNGHQAGDELLQFIGELLRGALRPTDHAVRYGGDEFVLILPGAGKSQAVMIAERITKMFAQYASRIKNQKPLSMSAGVASMADHTGGDAARLIGAADDALYDAKAKGKNGVAVAGSQPNGGKLVGAGR